MTRSRTGTTLLALSAFAWLAVEGGTARAQRGTACAGPPPCTHGRVADPKQGRCRPPRKDGGADGARGVINDAVSFCDVTPPCPEGGKPNPTNRSCTSAR